MDEKLQDYINEIPKTAGVYLFYAGKELIYIGKAINLRDRVKNHFQQPSYRDNLFIDKVSRISFIDTNSEIEALVLEAQLIKQHLPKFNVVWKDDKNYFFVAITKSEKPTVFITHQKSEANTEYIGPFIEGNSLKKILKYLRRVFPFYTSTKHPNNKCTWCHLGLCPGPTPDMKEYKKNLKKLALVLRGKRKTVLYSLKKEMAKFSKENNFEKAAQLRDRIMALENIMAHTKVIEGTPINSDQWEKTQKTLQDLLNIKKQLSKVECYDISNIQGKFAVGSMIVFIDGVPAKSQYKKFRIQMKNEPNDIAMLKEVFKRRLAHPEWSYPEVMLIDGGIAQLNAAINIKSDLPEAKNIKVISIAKGKRELLIEDKHEHIPLKELPQDIYNLIIHMDDEAHRFAITYHKKVRKQALLT